MPLLILLQSLNPSKLQLSKPYDSTQGIPFGVMAAVYSCVALFGLYTFFKVRKMLRNEREGKK
jgi:hypothetical protein